MRFRSLEDRVPDGRPFGAPTRAPARTPRVRGECVAVVKSPVWRGGNGERVEVSRRRGAPARERLRTREGWRVVVKVVAVDPGTHTGIAWGEFSARRDRPAEFGLQQVNCPDEVEGVFRIWEVIAREEPDVLVIEDFILLPPQAMKKKGGWSSDRRGLSPTRLGYGLKLLLSIAREEHAGWQSWDGDLPWVFRVTLEWQMASAMDVVPEKWLRQHGLWRTPTQIEGSRPGDGPHCMDALRHLIVWSRKK